MAFRLLPVVEQLYCGYCVKATALSIPSLRRKKKKRKEIWLDFLKAICHLYYVTKYIFKLSYILICLLILISKLDQIHFFSSQSRNGNIIFPILCIEKVSIFCNPCDEECIAGCGSLLVIVSTENADLPKIFPHSAPPPTHMAPALDLSIQHSTVLTSPFG